MSTTVSDWVARPSGGVLMGFATVVMPSGVIFHECCIFAQNGRWWASPASKPMIGRDGTAMRDAKTGKVRYSPVVTFTDKAVRDRWSAVVIGALHAAHPELLA